MLNNISRLTAAALAALCLFGCGNSNEWTVDGRIENAEGKTMYVEASDNGRWYALDSITLDAGGKFSFSHAPAGYPDIYRLRLEQSTLYFPIDSVETVTVIAKADAFESDYTLEGSSSAEALMAVDRRVQASLSRNGIGGIASDTLLKNDLSTMLLQDPSGIVSYYIINKRIGGIQLFNPANPKDLRIIGAVANAYDQFRPTDPRTTYLRNLFLSNRPHRDTAAPADTLRAREVSVFEIKLYDNAGNRHSLVEEASKGNVIFLNFIAYADENAPAYNRRLRPIYERYRDRGLRIFQVSLDTDEIQWRQTAANLPWITVYNPSTDEGVRNVMNYNVGKLPAGFIINRNGEVVKRVDDIASLENEIASYL